MDKIPLKPVRDSTNRGAGKLPNKVSFAQSKETFDTPDQVMLLSCNRPKRGLLKASMEFFHLRNVVTKLFSQFRSGLDDVGLGEQPNHLATHQNTVFSNHPVCTAPYQRLM